jgi:hypothetical protein
MEVGRRVMDAEFVWSSFNSDVKVGNGVEVNAMEGKSTCQAASG